MLLGSCLSNNYNAFADNPQQPQYDSIEPKIFRAKARFYLDTDKINRMYYPVVELNEVNWESGKVFRKTYEFKNYARKIPDGFVYQQIGSNHAWTSNDEFFYYGDYKNKFSFGVSQHIEGTILNTAEGIKAYYVFAEGFYENTPSRNRTRPVVSTLYEFDFTSKDLRIVNQLESDTSYLRNVLPGMEVYSIRYENSIDFYSITSNEYRSSIPGSYNHYDNEKMYIGLSGMSLTYDPMPSYGDYVYEVPNTFGHSVTIMHKDGSNEESKLINGDNPIMKYGVKYVGNNKYVYRTDPISTISLINNEHEQLLSDGGYTLGYFSPDDKYMLIYSSIKDEHYSIKKLKIFDIEREIFIQETDEYPFLNPNPAFVWVGNSIVTQQQLYFDGENEQPFLHLPTGIITQKNDSIRTLQSRGVQNLFYNFNPENYITFSDPIEVVVKGESVKYSGQGTFLTANNTAYIPLRDFISTIGGHLEVNDQFINVKYGKVSLIVDSMDNNNILYNGTIHVPLWDIAPKLGFSVDFQEPRAGSKSTTLWRRYVLE